MGYEFTLVFKNPPLSLFYIGPSGVFIDVPVHVNSGCTIGTTCSHKLVPTSYDHKERSRCLLTSPDCVTTTALAFI